MRINPFSLVFGCGSRSAVWKFSRFPAKKNTVAKEMVVGDRKPKELLDLAIAALGGDSARKKLKTCKITTRSTLRTPSPDAVKGFGSTTLIEDCYRYPDEWRRTIRRDAGAKDAMLFVVNGEHYWASRREDSRNAVATREHEKARHPRHAGSACRSCGNLMMR